LTETTTTSEQAKTLWIQRINARVHRRWMKATHDEGFPYLVWAAWDAAMEAPRIAITVYAVVWFLADTLTHAFGQDLHWWDGAGWWNTIPVALNPVTWAVLERAANWHEEDIPDITSMGGDGQRIWNTAIASDRSVHL